MVPVDFMPRQMLRLVLQDCLELGFMPEIHTIEMTGSLGRFDAELRLVCGLLGDSIECRDPLPGRHFQLVGDQFGMVPRPADDDIEGALVCQIRIADGHCGEDPVPSSFPESIHRDCPKPVHVLELRVAFG